MWPWGNEGSFSSFVIEDAESLAAQSRTSDPLAQLGLDLTPSCAL